jgi:carbon starvation protein
VIISRRELPTTETPFVESRLLAPAGLFPTGEERLALAGATAGDGGAVRSDRFTRESETASPRGGP